MAVRSSLRLRVGVRGARGRHASASVKQCLQRQALVFGPGPSAGEWAGPVRHAGLEHIPFPWGGCWGPTTQFMLRCVAGSSKAEASPGPRMVGMMPPSCWQTVRAVCMRTHHGTAQQAAGAESTSTELPTQTVVAAATRSTPWLSSILQMPTAAAWQGACGLGTPASTLRVTDTRDIVAKLPQLMQPVLLLQASGQRCT